MFLSKRTLPFLFCAVAAFPWAARATVTVKLDTKAGSMILDLYDDDKPKTVENFLKYIRDGRYANSFAHRLPQGFVLQGGGYTYSNADGFNTISKYDPIVNEYSVGATYSNTEGTIAMAKVPATDDNGNSITGGGPDSATSEWFINLGNNSTTLDSQNGGFTVFGKIVTDTSNALTRFKNFTPYVSTDGTDLIVNSLGFGTLPLYSVVNSSYTYLNDLVFTTWTITGGKNSTGDTRPVITSAATVYALQGTAFSYQIAATGNPTSFSLASGTLPAGVTLNTSTGLISGTPTDATPATLELKVAATAGGVTGSAPVTIGYNYPVISGATTATAMTEKPFSYQIQASHNPTAYGADGLPDGVTVNATTGLISGTPKVYGSGYVTLYAANAGGTYAASLYLTIELAPSQVVTKKKVTSAKGTVTLRGSANDSVEKIEVQPGKGGFKKAKGTPAKWTYTAKGLKPGTYKFKVRATASNGKKTITTVTVIVKGKK